MENANIFNEHKIARENFKMFQRIASKEPFVNVKKLDRSYNRNLESSPRANYIKLKKQENNNYKHFMEKIDIQFNQLSNSQDYKPTYSNKLPKINNNRRSTNENDEMEMEYNDFENLESSNHID